MRFRLIAAQFLAARTVSDHFTNALVVSLRAIFRTAFSVASRSAAASDAKRHVDVHSVKARSASLCSSARTKRRPTRSTRRRSSIASTHERHADASIAARHRRETASSVLANRRASSALATHPANAARRRPSENRASALASRRLRAPRSSDISIHRLNAALRLLRPMDETNRSHRAIFADHARFASRSETHR